MGVLEMVCMFIHGSEGGLLKVWLFSGTFNMCFLIFLQICALLFASLYILCYFILTRFKRHTDFTTGKLGGGNRVGTQKKGYHPFQLTWILDCRFGFLREVSGSCQEEVLLLKYRVGCLFVFLY